MESQEFINKYSGKETDVDGYYGAQCWDLFAIFNKELGYPVINCTSSGYVKDIWNVRHTNGVLDYYDECSVSSLQKGDWIIWGDSIPAPNSHIAMFVSYVGNNYVNVFGQNQGGVMAATTISMSTQGIIGCLRPKAYAVTNNVKPSGRWLFELDVPVIIRNGMIGKDGEDSGYYYDDGMDVYYDSVYWHNGNLFISYVSTSGIRRSVAIGDEDSIWGRNI